MKKVVSTLGITALIFSASAALAGTSKMGKTDEGCPEDCQQQIDALQSSQAQQDEQIKAQADMINKQAEEIQALSEAEINPWYVKAIVKATFMEELNHPASPSDIEADAGYGLGVAFGRQFGNFRTDLELSTQAADLDVEGADNIRIDTIMLNGTYSIPIYSGLSAYGTIGMGMGKTDISLPTLNGNETTFAYKAGLGVSYDINTAMAIDFGYEHLATSDVNIEGFELEDIRSNNIVAAFRYSF